MAITNDDFNKYLSSFQQALSGESLDISPERKRGQRTKTLVGEQPGAMPDITAYGATPIAREKLPSVEQPTKEVTQPTEPVWEGEKPKPGIVPELGKGVVRGVRQYAAGELDTLDWLSEKISQVTGMPKGGAFATLRDKIAPEQLDQDEQTTAKTIGEALGYGGAQLAGFIAMFVKPLQAFKLMRVARVADVGKMFTTAGKAGMLAREAAAGLGAATPTLEKGAGVLAKLGHVVGQTHLATPTAMAIAGGLEGAKAGERQASGEGRSPLGGAATGALKHGAIGFSMGLGFGATNAIKRIYRMPLMGGVFGGMSYAEGADIKRAAGDFIFGAGLGFLGEKRIAGEKIGLPKGAKGAQAGEPGAMAQPPVIEKESVAKLNRLNSILGATELDSEQFKNWYRLTGGVDELGNKLSEKEALFRYWGEKEPTVGPEALKPPEFTRNKYGVPIDLDIHTGELRGFKKAWRDVVKNKFNVEDPNKMDFKTATDIAQYFQKILHDSGAEMDPTVVHYMRRVVWEATGGKVGSPYILPAYAFRGDHAAGNIPEMWRLFHYAANHEEPMFAVLDSGQKFELARDFAERMTPDGMMLVSKEGQMAPSLDVNRIENSSGEAMWNKPVRTREDILSDRRVSKKVKVAIRKTMAEEKATAIAEKKIEKPKIMPNRDIGAQVEEQGRIANREARAGERARVAEEAKTSQARVREAKAFAKGPAVGPGPWDDEIIAKVREKFGEPEVAKLSEQTGLSPEEVKAQIERALEDKKRVKEARAFAKGPEVGPGPWDDHPEQMSKEYLVGKGFSDKQAELITQHTGMIELVLDKNWGPKDFKLEEDGTITPVSKEFISDLKNAARGAPTLTHAKAAADAAKMVAREIKLRDMFDLLDTGQYGPRYRRDPSSRVSLANLPKAEQGIVKAAEMLWDGVIDHPLLGTPEQIKSELDSIARKNGYGKLTQAQKDWAFDLIKMQNEANKFGPGLDISKEPLTKEEVKLGRPALKRPQPVSEDDINNMFTKDAVKMVAEQVIVEDIYTDAIAHREVTTPDELRQYKHFATVVREMEDRAKAWGFNKIRLADKYQVLRKMAQLDERKQALERSTKVDEEGKIKGRERISKRKEALAKELDALRFEADVVSKPLMTEPYAAPRIPTGMGGVESFVTPKEESPLTKIKEYGEVRQARPGEKQTKIAAREEERMLKEQPLLKVPKFEMMNPVEKKAFMDLMSTLGNAYEALNAIRVKMDISKVPLGTHVSVGKIQIGTSTMPSMGPMERTAWARRLQKAAKAEAAGKGVRSTALLGQLVTEEGLESKVPIAAPPIVSEYTMRQAGGPELLHEAHERASMERTRAKEMGDPEANLDAAWTEGYERTLMANIDAQIEASLQLGDIEDPSMAAMHGVQGTDIQKLMGAAGGGKREYRDPDTGELKTGAQLTRDADRLLKQAEATGALLKGEIMDLEEQELFASGRPKIWRPRGAEQQRFTSGETFITRGVGEKGANEYEVKIAKDSITPKEERELQERRDTIKEELTRRRKEKDPTLNEHYELSYEIARKKYPWLLAKQLIVGKAGKVRAPKRIIRTEEEYPTRRMEASFFVTEAMEMQHELAQIDYDLRGKAIEADGYKPIIMDGHLRRELIPQGKGIRPKEIWKFEWNGSDFDYGDPREIEAARLAELNIKAYLSAHGDYKFEETVKPVINRERKYDDMRRLIPKGVDMEGNPIDLVEDARKAGVSAEELYRQWNKIAKNIEVPTRGPTGGPMSGVYEKISIRGEGERKEPIVKRPGRAVQTLRKAGLKIERKALWEGKFPQSFEELTEEQATLAKEYIGHEINIKARTPKTIAEAKADFQTLKRILSGEFLATTEVGGLNFQQSLRS